MKNEKLIKVLLFDIETKPVKFWGWRTGKQVVRHDQIVAGEKFDIICLCYKWAHEKKVHSLQWDSNHSSAKMINDFVKVLETADVVVGQNSDSFDIKQVNTQRLLHGQPPIRWPVAEDTRKQIKKHFYVTSSSLEYMSQLLTGSGKDRMNFQDWIDIIEDDSKKAMAKMIAYCKKDVLKLQAVWEKLRPYVTPKAHRGVIKGYDRTSCRSCGSRETVKDGRVYNMNGYRQRHLCLRCGHRA